jgi:hypothetical protein
MDVFSWSMPFLAEKVVSMLYTIVKKGCDDDDEDVEIPDNIKDKKPDPHNMTPDEIKANRGLVMKGKVRSVARVNRMFTTLRYVFAFLINVCIIERNQRHC